MAIASVTGLVLLGDLGGKAWVWRSLAEWYTSHSKPSLLMPRLDSRLWSGHNVVQGSKLEGVLREHGCPAQADP